MHSTSTHETPFANLFPRFRTNAGRTQPRTFIPAPRDTDNEQDFVGKYMLQRAMHSCKGRDDVYDVLITLAPLLFKGSSGQLVFPIAATQPKSNLVIGWGTAAPQQNGHGMHHAPIVAAGVQIGMLQLWKTEKQSQENGNSAAFVAEIGHMIGVRIAQFHH